MAILRTEDHRIAAQCFTIEPDGMTIGRNPDCDIRIDHPSVSRRHALIVAGDRGYTITDLGSRNGTFVNGESVAKVTTLGHGDLVSLGSIRMRFLIPESETSDSEKKQRKLIDSAILTDEEFFKPINVTSQIDPSLLRGSSFLPDTIEGCVEQIRLLKLKLDVIVQLLKHHGGGSDQRELLSEFLDKLLRLFVQADFACLIWFDKESKQLELVDFKARDLSRQFRISRSVSQYAFDHKTAVLSEDLIADNRFDSSESMIHSRICSIMAVPVLDSTTQKALGIIQVDSRTTGRRFSNSDLDLLVSIAGLISLQCEHLRLQKMRHEEKLLSQEMQLAFQVQKGFLPNKRPVLAGYEFYDFYQPAKKVGGDFFDYFTLPDGRQAVIVADVSGKGIAAALIVAKLSSEARFWLLSEPSLPKALQKISNVFNDPQWEGRFITLALVVLDSKSHHISLVNAGHVYPVRKRGSRYEEIGVDHQGFAVGMIPDAEYEEVTFDMEPGDFLLLMSDGIPDATNADGDRYELDRVYTLLREDTSDTAQQLGEALIDSVRSFVGTSPQADDQCVVILKATPQSSEGELTEMPVSEPTDMDD